MPVTNSHNFSKKVLDGEDYMTLLNQLKPNDCSCDPVQNA